MRLFGAACAAGERDPAEEADRLLAGSREGLSFAWSRPEAVVACALLRASACFVETVRALLAGEAAISTTPPHFGHFVCAGRELAGASKE